jgi:glycosyltransferase involved in cell wall biosynthesis
LKVQLVDPSAFTPPYDRALAAALARGGVDVELVTTKFLYGSVPEADGYEVDERFYQRTASRGLSSSARLPFKGAEHLRDMLAFRRAPTDADLVHYQWLTLPGLDQRLLPPTRPRVMTAHYILPPNASRRAARAAHKVFDAMDAVVAHSEHGARRLREEVGLPAERVRVIPHGAFDYLTRLPEEKPLPEELEGAEGPVVLSFGLLRPYKGLENLLEAFTEVGGAELWIVGNPRMSVEPLHEAAALTGARVRFVTRFVEDAEIPAIFRRADVVALPYLDAEHSGVLYTGLAFGKPMVVSAVGGFPEVAEAGAARLVPPGDTAALAGALRELIEDERAREELAAAARAAAAGPYSWDEAARRTLALYEELLARPESAAGRDRAAAGDPPTERR